MRAEFEEYAIGSSMDDPGDRYGAGPVAAWSYDRTTGDLRLTWPTGHRERWICTRHWEDIGIDGRVVFEGYACRDVGQRRCVADRHVRVIEKVQ